MVIKMGYLRNEYTDDLMSYYIIKINGKIYGSINNKSEQKILFIKKFPSKFSCDMYMRKLKIRYPNEKIICEEIYK